MTVVYVESYDHVSILNVSTVNQGSTAIEAYLEEPTIDLAKLEGYFLTNDEGKYILKFDQEKYDQMIHEKEKEESIKNAEILKEKLQDEYILQTASDEDAYAMRYLYEEWKPDTEYETGDRRLFSDILYKCKKDHTSQAQYTPDLIPALWDIVNADTSEDSGTLENPIIIPDNFSSMVYVKGKYYKEGDTVYHMNRDGMQDGEEISLTHKPSQLVGHYFEIVQ